MERENTVDFIGIGAPKAGTTWLARALDAHPEVCFSSSKATDFFCRELRAPRGSYMRYDGGNLRQYELFFKRCRTGQKTGEFSVNYMRERDAAEDISRNFPDVKIIAVLREPVARFISHYRFWRYTLGTENSPLDSLVRSDEPLSQHGMYGENLQRYFRRFPRENIKVLIYEEMKADPHATLRDLYDFLGVDSSFVPSELMGEGVNATMRVRSGFLRVMLRRVHYAMIWLGVESLVSGAMKNRFIRFFERVNYSPLDREPVSDETKARIRQMYREDRKVLEALLGRDLSGIWGPPDEAS